MELGRFETNKIYNEDCFKAIKELPDKSVDCIYADVPYLMSSGGCGKKEIGKRMSKSKIELMGIDYQYDDNLSATENLRKAKELISDKDSNLIEGFDYEKFIYESFRVMRKCNLFIWCSVMQINNIMNEIKKYTKSNINLLVWCKTNPSPMCNNLWLSDLEYCLYVRDEGVVLNDGYELKSKWYVSPINKGDKDLYEHPTIKPLDLVERHLLHSTQPNDIVLDCFLGSGTTAVACKETGRQYIGFEINEKYFKIALDRLNGISQEDRQKKEIGQLTIDDFM